MQEQPSSTPNRPDQNIATRTQWPRWYVLVGPVVLLILAAVVALLVINQGTRTSGSAASRTTLVVIAAPTSHGTLADLIAKGDALLAAGDFADGLSYYLAYISQNPADADVMFKIGAAYCDPRTPHPITVWESIT